MKNLIKLSAIFILFGILFSSCKYNRSMIKRHYNKGYYMAYSKNKSAIPGIKKENKEVVPEKIASTYSEQKVLEKNNSIQDNMVATTNEKQENAVFSQKNNDKTLSKKVEIKNVITQPKHLLLELKKSQSGSSDGGLSLFWIIILVILILWALGFLAGGWGLGGLINILLIIALILLILWLLRIV